MPHFFAIFIDNIQAIVEHGGYTILFIASVLEGIPLIGSLVPGHTVVILSGFLIKIGIMNWIVVGILVIAGAMMGDFVGYSVGKKYGFIFLEKFGKYFLIKPEHLEKAKKLVTNHTGKAIIFGRFSPITRPLAPFIVGASNVHIKRFWFYDFIGVLLWAVSAVTLGYLFGASYKVAAGLFGKFIVIAIILSILIIWAYKIINKQFHIFAKYELFVLIANLFGLIIFFKTVQDALKDKGVMASLDIWINNFLYIHSTEFGISLMNIITNILSPTSFLIITLIGIVFFLKKKQWRYSIISLLATGGGLFLNAFMKEVVERVRPMNAFIIENGFSFPSGHAVAATIFFTLIIYFFARKINSMVWRELFISASVLLIILTAISRLYLEVHWLSDVLAGIGFGLFWTTLMILLVRYAGMIIENLKERMKN
jgi:undecaprenyl-diphosphatase